MFFLKKEPKIFFPFGRVRAAGFRPERMKSFCFFFFRKRRFFS